MASAKQIDLEYEKKGITRLEVFPTSRVIAGGTIDSDTGLEYKVDVPACDTMLI